MPSDPSSPVPPAPALLQLQPGRYAVRGALATSDPLGPILEAALEAVRADGGRALHVRLEPSRCGPDAASALTERGFRLLSQRVEYQADIASLPDDDGTPLDWRPLEDVSVPSLAAAAAVLGRVGQGDPDWEPADDPLALLQGYLADPAYSTGPHTVALGRLDGAEVAFVMAQTAVATGVGRLTYLGVDPSARDLGLGAWVHRRGFGMLRAQGATRYQGGTLVQNASMQRLFERHGCSELRRLDEWVWTASAD